MKQRLKVYYSSCSKREIQKRKQWQNAAVASRARRVLLGCVYQSITCPGGTPDTIMEEDPACLRAINETLATMRHHHPAQAVVDLAYRFDIARGPTLGSERSRAPPLMADPSAPASCYPDRIVECIWIADQRPRLVILNFGGSDEAGIVMDGLASSNSNKNTRLFLQRRLLTQPYNQDSTRLYCPTCWQCFLSRPGLKYHTESSACIKRASKQSTAIREELELVDQRARKLVAALQPLEAQQRQQHKYDADRRRRVNQMPLSRRRTAPLVMWVDKEGDMDSMGAASNVRATVVPIRSTDTIFINQEGGSSIRHTVDTIISMCNERDETVDGIGAEAENSHSGILSPDDMIAQLQGELHYAQGQILGPMYPQVWKALGYVVPRKKVPPRKKRKRSLGGDDAATMKHSAETDSAIKAEASIADVDRPGALKDALIVDTRTLVAEVNAGRYPSFRRFFGEHLHHCAICSYKTSPPNITPNTQATLTSNHLFPCVFCQRAIHLSCAQTKYIIKEPEPEEDFMCHHCIGIIVSRRSRAEQRRQDRKQPPVSCTTSGIDIVSGSSRAPSQRRTLDHHLQRHLMIGVVTGRELECVAMQSQRVGELAELLRDAQSRLSMTMTVVNMNNARRRACQE